MILFEFTFQINYIGLRSPNELLAEKSSATMINIFIGDLIRPLHVTLSNLNLSISVFESFESIGIASKTVNYFVIIG